MSERERQPLLQRSLEATEVYPVIQMIRHVCYCYYNFVTSDAY